MKKFLIAASLAAFVGPVAAQVCDQEGKVTISYDGKPDSVASGTVYGIPKAEVDKLHKRALRVVDEASKQQDKGGKHQIEFDETWTCDGVKTKGQGVAGVMVQGVTLKGANKIARMAEKQMSQQIGDEEQRAAKGKRRALGRD